MLEFQPPAHDRYVKFAELPSVNQTKTLNLFATHDVHS